MSSSNTPGHKLQQLCEKLFEQSESLPAPVVINEAMSDDIIAINPARGAAFFVERGQQPGIYFIVHWVAGGTKCFKAWFSTAKAHLEAQNNGKSQPPPKQLLTELAGAIPLPTEQFWGASEANRIVELILFGDMDLNHSGRDVGPHTYHLVTKEQQHRKALFLASDWLDMKTFWDRVKSGVYTNAKKTLLRTNPLSGIGPNDTGCVVINDIVLAPHRLWQTHPNLTVDQLQKLRPMSERR